MSSAAGSAVRPLRILYPASLTMGGAERQMLLLAERLPRDRFDVSFITLGGWTTHADHAVAAGARVHSLGAARRRSTPMPLFALKVAGRTLDYIRINRRERYDIVDAWLYLGYGLAALTRPLTRTPVLISGRRSLSRFKEGFGPVERAVDAVARRRSDLIVANSTAVADDVAAREGIDRGAIRVIRNGVEIPAPVSPEDRRRIRSTLGLAPHHLVVAAVGSLKPGKGQVRLVEAMPDLLAAVPAARLVLVGDGPGRSAIEARVSELGLDDRVVMTGAVPDARTLYGAFDILASGSDAEGLPNAVLEGAAAGNAIIATAAGGTVEIVHDGKTGVLVPVGHDAALRAGLVRLARDDAARERLGLAARAHVSACFGIERFVRETADLYEEMSARPRGRAPVTG